MCELEVSLSFNGGAAVRRSLVSLSILLALMLQVRPSARLMQRSDEAGGAIGWRWYIV